MGDVENDAAYSRWRQSATAASRSIDLTIRPRETPPSLPAPEVYLETVKTAQGEILRGQQPVMVRTDDPIVEIRGRVEGAPQGAYVWVLVHSPNTPVWETLGPALLEPPRWRLPLAASSPRNPGAGTGWRMMAILSTDAQLTGWVNYASWRRQALAVSESLSLQFANAGETRDLGSAETSLRIRRVAGTVVGKGPAEAALSDDPSVQGSVTGLPADAGVWVASRHLQAQQWVLSGPALIDGDHWYLSQTRFVDGTVKADHPGEFDLVALVANGEPPAPAIAQADLRWLAHATSPVVRIRDFATKSRARQRRAFTSWRTLPMDLWLLLLAIVLLLIVLITLASLFEVFARLCLRLAQNVDRLSAYLHRQIGYLPRTRADASVIGLIVLAIAFFWGPRLGLGVIAWFCVHLLIAPLHLLARLAELAGKSRQPDDTHNKKEVTS